MTNYDGRCILSPLSLLSLLIGAARKSLTIAQAHSPLSLFPVVSSD